jgi:hypothetical protein
MLYRGDLLPGFHISDAPDFECWLDSERTRLRGRVREASWAVADLMVRDGNGAGAAEAGHRAVALAPTDEAAICRLVLLLERLGDRAAAVRAYEAFAQRLGEEYELQPSEQTQALITRIRAGSSSASATRRVDAPLPPKDHETTVPAAPLSRRSRGRLAAGVGLTVTAALIIMGAPWYESHRAPATSASSDSVVAVFPFRVAGADPSVSYLGEGMVDLLAARLTGVG